MRLSDTKMAMLKRLCLYLGKDENEIYDTELYQEFAAAGGGDWPGMFRFLIENDFIFGLAEDPYKAEIYRVSSRVRDAVKEEEARRGSHEEEQKPAFDPPKPPDDPLRDFLYDGRLLTPKACQELFGIDGSSLSRAAEKRPEIRRDNPGGRGYIYRYDVVALLANRKAVD
jgi:hypothetical protein